MPKEETLKKQQKVTIGDRTINITDGYGVRGKDFKDREGQHSKGIDMTTDNKRVISLTDGVVEVASLDGSPTLVDTDKEQSGGYYLIIKNDDGTRSQYMHLDAMTPEEQKNIIGKRVKRGDDLGGYGVGSGSGTNPHVKYRVFTGDVGTQLETHIDPSTYISGNNKSAYDSHEPSIIEPSKYSEQKGKYRTVYEKSNGHKDVAWTDNPLEIKNINGEYTLKEKNKDAYRRIDEDSDGFYSFDELSDNRINDLINKSKKEGLTTEEHAIARRIWDVKEAELIQEKKDRREIEGWFEDSYSTTERNANAIRREKNRLKNKMLELETREAIRRRNIDAKQHEQFLSNNKQKALAGEISPEEFKKIQSDYQAWKEKDNALKADLDNVFKGAKNNIYPEANPTDYDRIRGYVDSYKDIAVTEDKLSNVAKSSDNLSNDSKEGKTGSTTTTPLDTSAVSIDEGVAEDPNNLTDNTEEVDLGKGDYTDVDYLQKQLDEVNKQLEDSEKAEEFTPDLSMLDKQNSDRYGNLISMASDLGVGMMGLKGAMEEVPVYEKGEMFKEYTDEAYRQRNMGLTAEEEGLRRQLAERGFGYDVKNIRRLSGGSSGVALGNLGRAAGTLQNRYAQIAAEDSAVRRMNQQRFDRAAGADESLNRRKFEDSFKVAMLNKEMGAQLVRDKMKNMHERQMFEKQYGKGSIYDELSREMLIGKQYNNHALKMAQQYQKEKQEDYLKSRKDQLTSDIDKAK